MYNSKSIIEVIETRRVQYERHSFLFFHWNVFVSATSIDKKIEIFSNDKDIKEVYFNGNLLTDSTSH